MVLARRNKEKLGFAIVVLGLTLTVYIVMGAGTPAPKTLPNAATKLTVQLVQSKSEASNPLIGPETLIKKLYGTLGKTLGPLMYDAGPGCAYAQTEKIILSAKIRNIEVSILLGTYK
jgi:hypothetical protein